MKAEIFGILQSIGRSFMLPIAILPIAGLLLGLGSSFMNPTTIETYGMQSVFGNGTLLHALLTIMSSVGNTIFGNLPIIFAVGVAIGMAKSEKEVAVLVAMMEVPAAEKLVETAPEAPAAAVKRHSFCSPFTGTIHPITEAPDEAFAQKMTGDGFFVYPTDNIVVAPADGEVSFVFDKKHAIGMVTDDGIECFLHIGIDTVKLDGQGFKVFVENGQTVKKGDTLMEFDDEFIKKNAPSDACLVIFTDLDETHPVHMEKSGAVKALDEVVTF